MVSFLDYVTVLLNLFLYLSPSLPFLYLHPFSDNIHFMIVLWNLYFKLVFEICDFSFEKSPRHDAYVPRFEAELAQFCEKMVGSIALSFST